MKFPKVKYYEAQHRVSDLPVYSGLANPPRGKFRDPKIGVP